jgi:hypothetical protein
MADRYDVLTSRKYTDKQGNEKTSWTKIGTAFACRDGVSLNVTLDAFPVNGQLYITPPKPRAVTPERYAPSTPASEEPEDGLPF